MSPFEAIAALLILIAVWLVARRSIWNYAFGAVGAAMFGWVVFDARLYSDALLQAFFLALQFYGWRQWSRHRAESGTVVVEMLTPRARLGWAATILVATLGWGWLMHRFTDAALPFLDALVAMVSVAAQILLSRRKVENWGLWIAVNALSVWLYTAKQLWAFAGVYVILFALSLWGLAKWRAAGQGAAA
ncbi:MAG: nicotinamide riboside transporter PnuC [Pseudomonadota bacterium]|nr:nicotinamide riboside transporter PnuC [Pseudomonadota bacterium]